MEDFLSRLESCLLHKVYCIVKNKNLAIERFVRFFWW